MSTTLRRIFTSVTIMLGVCTSLVLAYRFLADFTWLDSIWIVIVSVSSVGYGERSSESDFVKILNIITILVGMSTVAYIGGTLVQLMFEGELQRMFGHDRRLRDIKALRHHTIICGYGRVGELLAADLKRQGQSFVVIEQDEKRAAEVGEHGHLFITGDATEDDTLRQAGIEHAKTVITALPDDARNVFITLSSRNLNQKLFILARAEDASTEQKLRQAGANRVVMPATMGAQQLARMVTHPSTADLMQLFAERADADVELDEILVSNTSTLIGVTVQSCGGHHRYGLLFLAVKKHDGKMIFNPNATYEFHAGDIIILMGDQDQIRSFRTEYKM